jgi:hypothetical protein
MEYYDGNKVTEEINPVMCDVNWYILTSFLFLMFPYVCWWPYCCIIYRCEMLHYQIFHPLNQAELPAMLDKYRIGGRPLDFEDDSSQSVNF